VSNRSNGAFTGEISCEQLKDSGIDWTLIGHSERRQLYGATDEFISAQLKQAKSHDLHIIYCLGETDQQRKDEQTIEVIENQLEVVKGVIPDSADWLKYLVIAYEPVWAIGTGQTATAQQAQQVHQYIRTWINQHIPNNIGAQIRIIYGGSVTGKNSAELIEQQDVDGFLVGGASLKPDFADIIKATGKQTTY